MFDPAGSREKAVDKKKKYEVSNSRMATAWSTTSNILIFFKIKQPRGLMTVSRLWVKASIRVQGDILVQPDVSHKTGPNLRPKASSPPIRDLNMAPTRHTIYPQSHT